MVQSSEQINNHAGFIWGVADLLRGDYKQSEYGRVILPMTVIRGRSDRVCSVGVDGPSGTLGESSKWLETRGPEWRSNIVWATLDLSGPYRATFDTMLPDAVQVADPFHVVRSRQLQT